jgi:hypothetical protein
MSVRYASLLACLCLAGCGASGSTTSGAPAAPTSTSRSVTTVAPPPAPAPAATPPPSPPRPKPAHNPCPPRSAGALPQTERIPSASSPCFHAVIRALWRGIRDDSPRTALYAFFPLRAYEQVKTIGDPAGDYAGRLLIDYRLDLQAAHQLLGAKPSSARLVGAIVPQAYIHWVPPGACENGIGYYEVPNSRLVYRVAGEVRSIGIASLISWRGYWYVVHLGAVVRPGAEGLVDDPSVGPGTPAYSGTC